MLNISRQCLVLAFGFLLVVNEYPEFQGLDMTGLAASEADADTSQMELVNTNYYDIVPKTEQKKVATQSAGPTEPKPVAASVGADTLGLVDLVGRPMRRVRLFAEACWGCGYRRYGYGYRRRRYYGGYGYRRRWGCGYCGKRK